MQAAFLHALGDALGSVVVVTVGLVVEYADGDWRYYSDPVLTLIILAIIAKSAIPLVRHCSHILLQGTPQNMLTSDVQVRPRRVAVLGQ